MSQRDSAPLLNLLVAYPYMTKAVTELVAANREKVRFLLDSGAFTAWKAGKKIAVDDYCRFIEGMPFPPWRYFALDVVGDPKGTLRNYELMLKRGFKPVPIFTRGEDLSVLEDYYRTSDVVGVGGLVGTPGNRGFVNGIMKHVGKRRVHWLGFTDVEFLKHYRPYMCDSSTWDNVPRYCVLTLYLGRGRVRQFKKETFAKKVPAALHDAIESYGVDPRALAKEAAWQPGQRCLARALSARSAVRLSDQISSNLGTLMFNAAGSEDVLTLLLAGYEDERRA